MSGPKPSGHFTYNSEHAAYMAHREANKARDARWLRAEQDFRDDPPLEESTNRRSSGFYGSDSGRQSGNYTDCSANMNAREAQPYASRVYDDHDGHSACQDCQEEYNRRGTQSACHNCQQKARAQFSGAYQASPSPQARLPPHRGLPCNSTTNNSRNVDYYKTESQAGPGYPHLFVGPAHERYCQKCGCKAPCYESCRWAKQ